MKLTHNTWKGCWLKVEDFNRYILELLGDRPNYGKWTFIGKVYD